MKNYAIPVLTVSIAMALATAGMALAGPVLPGYASSFGLPISGVGLFISLNSATAMLLAVPFGALSDRYARKPVMLMGMSLLALGALLLYLAWFVPALFAAQVLIGAGTAAVTTASMSQLLDRTDSDHRSKAISLYMLIIQIPTIAGSALGGQLAYRAGDRAVFLSYAVLAALGGLYSLVFVRDKLARFHTVSGQADFSPMYSTGRAGLTDKRALLVVYLVQLGFMLCFQGLIGTVLPLFVGVLGFDSRVVGSLLAIVTLTVAVCLLPSGILADSLGRREVLIPAAILGGVGLVLLHFAVTVPVLVLGVVLMGICCGLGMTIPAALLGDLAPAEARGKAMGLFRSIGQLGGTISGIVFGITGQYLGLANTFLLSLVIWIAITAAMFLLPKGRPARVPVPVVTELDAHSPKA
jgi:DHA1 family multidrug resistance protein-like MFS transporter